MLKRKVIEGLLLLSLPYIFFLAFLSGEGKKYYKQTFRCGEKMFILQKLALVEKRKYIILFYQLAFATFLKL